MRPLEVSFYAVLREAHVVRCDAKCHAQQWFRCEALWQDAMNCPQGCKAYQETGYCYTAGHQAVHEHQKQGRLEVFILVAERNRHDPLLQAANEDSRPILYTFARSMRAIGRPPAHLED